MSAKHGGWRAIHHHAVNPPGSLRGHKAPAVNLPWAFLFETRSPMSVTKRATRRFKMGHNGLKRPVWTSTADFVGVYCRRGCYRKVA
jgi:hypothetical protein